MKRCWTVCFPTSQTTYFNFLGLVSPVGKEWKMLGDRQLPPDAMTLMLLLSLCEKNQLTYERTPDAVVWE